MKAEEEQRRLLGNNPPSIYELWSPREPEETWQGSVSSLLTEKENEESKRLMSHETPVPRRSHYIHRIS